jgi:hypothetical protein
MFNLIFGKDSAEAALWREYEKKYFSPQKQRGYSWLMSNIVPVIEVSGDAKILYRVLYAEPMIAFMSWRLGKTDVHPEQIEIAQAKNFICLCEDVGNCVHEPVLAEECEA